MTDVKTTNKVTDSMLDAVSQVEANMNQAESAVRNAAERASELGDQLGDDVKHKAADSIKDVESYIREKPLQAAGIAFAAGLITAVLLRK